MNKFILNLIFIFSVFSCYAEIKKINKMEEVFKEISDVNSNTLIIFDVDMVLVQPSEPAYQMVNIKRFSALSKSFIKEIPTDKLMIFLSLMTISSDPTLIEDSSIILLDYLKERGIPSMALTASLTGKFGLIKNMEEWRVNCLCNLGIDFSLNAPYQKSLVFDNLKTYRNNYSVYLNGILFVNGTVVTKGEAFLAFLEQTKLSFDKIIFIDDREENLKEFEAALQSLNNPIDYFGLHYTGAQMYPSKLITESEFQLRWQELLNKVKQIS